MISSNRSTKAKRQGIEAYKKTAPHMRYGQILVQNPYSHGNQKVSFSKGFSYALNNFKFLLTVNE